MNLLEQIQNWLEQTYHPSGLDLADCLIGPQRFAELSDRAGNQAQALCTHGRTFLRRSGTDLAIAIFYAPEIITTLERNDPRRSLNERNVDALIVFIEEIDHALQAAWAFAEGRRSIESEDFILNLELEAKIDTCLILKKLAHSLIGGPPSDSVHAWIESQVFDHGHQAFESPRMRKRYGLAETLGVRFIHNLSALELSERQEALRTFRAMDWKEKLRSVVDQGLM